MATNKNKQNKRANVGSTIERNNARIDATGEVFTPIELCERMVLDIPEDILKKKEATFIDNSAGCGNFIMALIKILTEKYGFSREYVIDHKIYAVEFMEDNHKELCDNIGVPYDHKHYVCADALNYHYRFDGTSAGAADPKNPLAMWADM